MELLSRVLREACIYCAVYIRNDEMDWAVMIMKSRRDVDMNSERCYETTRVDKNRHE